MPAATSSTAATVHRFNHYGNRCRGMLKKKWGAIRENPPVARTAFAVFAILAPAFLQLLEGTAQRLSRPRPHYLQEGHDVRLPPAACFPDHNSTCASIARQ